MNIVKVLNLEKVSRIKRNNLVVEYCGGHYTKREAMNIGGIGVGGLKYLEGAEIIDSIKRDYYLRSNIETLKDGLAFYLRDNAGNYMLLIHKSEILSISFDKENDELKERSKFSLFEKCIAKGIPYHYSKLMLMEDEIVKLNPTKLKLITSGLDELNFECTRRNPLKVKEYFVNSPFADKLVANYNTYEYL